MLRKAFVILILIFFSIIVVGPAQGSDLIVKKPAKVIDQHIPTVLSSQKAFKSRNRLMQSPGTIMDSTYYDWQANGGFDDHLTMFDDQGIVKIHAVWTIAYQEDTSDHCQAEYNCWSGSPRGENPAEFCLFAPPSGLGSLSMLADGSLVVCSTAQIDSFRGAIAAVDAFPCIRAFSFFDTSRDTVGLWPRISVNSDDSFVMTGISTEVFHGVADGVMWIRGPGGWQHFSDIASDWMHDDMEPPTIHSGTNGKVGVIIPDYAGSVRLFESTDYGETFEVLTISGADTANLPAGIDSTAARLGWINSDITYLEDEPHVIWSAGQGAKIGGEYGLLDFKSTIFHWSPSTGIDTVVVASTQSADPSRDDYVPTPFNHLSVDWPSIGLAVDGRTLVVAYTAFNTDDIDSTTIGPPLGYVDIWMTTSSDNGETWTEPQNVTNPDGTILGWDDRYPSIAKINIDNEADPSKDVYMIYQSDDLAGTLVMGTEGSLNMDYIKFVGIDLAAVGIGDGRYGGSGANIPKVFSLSQNYPNPFNPSTTIQYDIPEVSSTVPVKVFVYDVQGRLVRKLVDKEKASGRYQVHWDGSLGW
jgi:hypothetical protein